MPSGLFTVCSFPSTLCVWGRCPCPCPCCVCVCVSLCTCLEARRSPCRVSSSSKYYQKMKREAYSKAPNRERAGLMSFCVLCRVAALRDISWLLVALSLDRTSVSLCHWCLHPSHSYPFLRGLLPSSSSPVAVYWAGSTCHPEITQFPSPVVPDCPAVKCPLKYVDNVASEHSWALYRWICHHVKNP